MPKLRRGRLKGKQVACRIDSKAEAQRRHNTNALQRVYFCFPVP